MKIAFMDVTTTVSFGGIQTAVWQLAIALTDLGHEVHVYGRIGDIKPNLHGREIAIHQFPFKPRDKVINIGSRFQRIVERFSFAQAAKQHVQQQDFDWLILTKPFDFFWPRLLNNKTKFAFMSGGTDFFRGDRYLSKKIDAWLACSHFNAWQIQHHYKKFPYVMYNGVDTEHFKPLPNEQRAALRRKLGYSDEDTILVFAGRLVGWKGIRVVLEAMSEHFAEDEHLKFLVVGDGEQLAYLQSLAHGLGLDSRIQWYGKVVHQDLPAFYSAMDIGVFPSIGDEAFGIAIAEAMSCGLPIIASHIGGIPEVVGNDTSCGYLFTAGHSADLALQLRKILVNKEMHTQMGINARQRIINCYMWQSAAQRLEKVLQKSIL